MSAPTPRLRMFAGPNGSGKSTLKTVLPPALLYVYLNADEIERQIRSAGTLDLNSYHVKAEADEVLGFFKKSRLLQEHGLEGEAARLRYEAGRVLFADVKIFDYFAAVMTDFIRQKLLAAKSSYSFETVMSHPGKVELLARAQREGYRTYLYYVATNDPEINIGRVRYRVSQGGHDVPEEKIRSRYERSLQLLFEAIKHTNRAYIWDNSRDGRRPAFLAEITEGREMELQTDRIPAWFKHAVWDKIQAP